MLGLSPLARLALALAPAQAAGVRGPFDAPSCHAYVPLAVALSPFQALAFSLSPFLSSAVTLSPFVAGATALSSFAAASAPFAAAFTAGVTAFSFSADPPLP